MDGEGVFPPFQLSDLIQKIDEAQDRSARGHHVIDDENAPGGFRSQQIDIPFVESQELPTAGDGIRPDLDHGSSG